MGILRLILALAVVIAHSSHLYGVQLYGLRFTGGVISVQAFYMLSGFYMALILSEKYVGTGGYRLFVTNRFLRVYPMYWIVLLLTVTLSVIPAFTHIFGFSLYDYVGEGGPLGLWSRIYLALTNLVLFGQDAVLFQGVNNGGHVYFTSNYRESAFMLYTFMPCPQAWTLSLELCFYLIAPFLIRMRTFSLLALLCSSLLLRGYIYFGAGLYQDPWTYRFFPTELAFFISGMISYRMFTKLTGKAVNPATPVLATGLIVGLTLAYQFLPGQALKQWGYYCLLFAAMPLLFIFSRKYRSIDGRIGELSYPVYISHIFVIFLLSPFLSRNTPSDSATVIICVSTFIFSLLLVHFVSDPIERYRQGRISGVAA